MKKKIFGSLAILTIALIVAFNVNLSTKKSNMTSLLALANVEALADGETVYIHCIAYPECECFANWRQYISYHAFRVSY